MQLAICAQDLHFISLALVERGRVMEHVDVQVVPEGYLRLIDETLRAWGKTMGDLDGLVVVTGPGSFTSSRVSTSIANALAFARHLPIFALQNPLRLPLLELLGGFTAPPHAAQAVAFPTYDREAHITHPKGTGDNPLAQASVDMLT